MQPGITPGHTGLEHLGLTRSRTAESAEVVHRKRCSIEPVRMAESAAVPPPIEPGEIVVRAGVTIVYEIAPLEPKS